MPFKSEQQRKLMYAAAQDPAVAKKTGVPQSVAKEFIEKDESGVTEFMDAVIKGDAAMMQTCSDRLNKRK